MINNLIENKAPGINIICVRQENETNSYKNGVLTPYIEKGLDSYEKGRAIDKDQLEAIKTTLLAPNEVKFSKNLTNDKCYSSSTETDSIASTGGISDTKSKIPDGGYGWVVVLASVVVSLIADGLSFSFGLIYTELLKYFGESKSKTAWIGSLFLATPLMSGPIMSNLVDRYGCRKMTILGGIISGIGLVLSSYAQSVEMLYLTFGIITGIGLGFTYVTAVVSIAFWFDKKRTLAIGIGASGTGIGTFLYAPFTQWLLDTYGWRGATLILAGTIFNLCVCGTLMRDPEWLIEENRLESRSQSVGTFSNSSVCLDEIKKLLETGAPTEDVLETLVTNYNTEANQQIPVPEMIAAEKKYKSELCLPTFTGSHLNVLQAEEGFKTSRRSLRKKDEVQLNPQEYLSSIKKTVTVRPRDRHLASAETLNQTDSLSDDNNVSYTSLPQSHVGSKLNTSRFSLDENMINGTDYDEDQGVDLRKGTSLDIIYETETQRDSGESWEHFHNPSFHRVSMDRSAVAGFNPKLPATANNVPRRRRVVPRNSHYFQHMRVHRNSITYRSAILNTHRYRMKASSCPNIYRNSMTTLAKEEKEKWYDEIVDLVKSILDFSLFLDPKFALINFSILLLFIWFVVPYFYITEHLQQYGMNADDGAFLISVIGIFNTIGMIAYGWLGDKPWVNVTKTYAGNMIVCGISTLLIPVAGKNYVCLCLLATVFGLTFASSFSFTPNILVRIVDLDDFTCAYGLVLLVQGIGNLIGPPLAGMIYEYTLSWDAAFYVAGIFIAVSGLLAYLVALLEDRDEAAEKAKDGEKQLSIRN